MTPPSSKTNSGLQSSQPPPAKLRPVPAPPVPKPKSRFLELNCPPRPGPPKKSHSLPTADPIPSSDSDSDDDDGTFSDKFLPDSHLRRRCSFGLRAAAEALALVPPAALLISVLFFKSLRHREFWGVKIWRWCVVVMSIFSGRLISGWLVWIAVFLIERHFLLQEKVLYFVYGLRKSVRGCVWLGLVLLAWYLVLDSDRADASSTGVLLHRISRGLVAVFVACTIWLIKIIFVKVLASSFHVATFFDRMKESVFHHYVLEALSGDPIDREEGKIGGGDRPRRVVTATKSMAGRLDMERLRRLSRARVSAGSVRRLVGHVMRTGLTTVSRTVDELVKAGELDIGDEVEAMAAAQRIFKNVAGPANKYIYEDDLRRFLTEEEVQTIFPMFEGALDTGRIKKSAFRNWVVRAYRERKSLAHSLNDTKTAVQQLHKLASVVVSVIIFVVSLLVMGVATTKVFVAITSQLLLLGFFFQSTGKTLFESIVFVFVMHPFDVGDRCVIDGVQMIVEEMNILTTVFLRHDNEKIYYPNAVLLTKPISNFYRSPHMFDTIEFHIDVYTPVDTIAALRKAIQAYLESKPKHWNPKHTVLVKEIENVNKMKMSLNVLHTMNHQNFPERNSRRSELVFELKKIFESLGIKYNLLPQEVHLTQVLGANPRIPAPPDPAAYLWSNH
ncbi:hypothetical protein KFK09_020314 [Dendrobium nobile]|uniref:Mechanosensitive ion channel protein n=1 Tax=Dendrobium nobile TaxID=94219 RepID=A0A8T3ATG2_DENNO|nr:hypothetical protein KFK09_020314 [Dendrobium nobile]